MDIPHLHHGFDARLFASSFGLIFLAEIPDKTALATLVLATGNRPFAVFYGVAAAFVIQSLVAVSVGSAISLFPREGIRIVAGALFLIFAAAMWGRGRGTDAEGSSQPSERSFARTMWTSFVVIFLAEWGDLTQLATAALSARYPQPVTIFLSATLALWSVTALAILVGNRLKQRVDPRLMQRIAAVAFVIIGLLILCGVSLQG